MATFAERLKRIRQARGLTQEELGSRVNVSKVSVSGYENGNRSPDMDTLQRLADTLEVSVDYLLGRDASAPEEIDPEWIELYETLKSKSAEMEATTMLRSVGRLSKGQIKSILQVLEMIEAEEAEEGKGTDNKGD